MYVMARNSSTPLLNPDLSENAALAGRYKVVIFNNEYTPVDEVIRILIEATGCDEQEAYIETWEAHHYGQAPVHFDSEAKCHTIARVINTVGVETEVAKEWND